MGLFNILFQSRRLPKGVDTRDDLEKLKSMLQELKWQEMNKALLPSDNHENIPVENIVSIGITSTKEINGMIENKLRIYGFDAPEDFCCWKLMQKYNDEYVIAITEQGKTKLKKKDIISL